MTRPAYYTDLTEEQWQLLAPLIPPGKAGGRPRTVDMREVVNGIQYVLRTGCSWRLLPHDLPPWGTVHYYYRRFRLEGAWEKMHEALRDAVREQAGREKSPSAAVIDSQTVKTTEKGGICGYDAGKKVKGRKRHIVVDTMGMLLAVVVHAAGIQDRDGAKLVWEKLKDRFARLKLIWADGGYRGKLVEWTKKTYSWVLEIVKRNDDVSGFEVLPKRWIVERTFAWLGRYRRLAKDYEEKTESSETMILLAMINLMSRRLTQEKTF